MIDVKKYKNLFVFLIGFVICYCVLSIYDFKYSYFVNNYEPYERYNSKENGSNIINRIGLFKNHAYYYTTRNYKLNLPSFLHYFKHLGDNNDKLQPSICISKHRKASIVIGLPTAKREGTSYLLETLYSLVNSMNGEEKQDTLIIVQVLESTDDVEFVNRTISELYDAFKEEIEDGLVDVIVPPKEFYVDIDNYLNETQGLNPYKDDLKRYRWRTRQSYDFAYLMSYSLKRGNYYLQLEDDVMTTDGYIATINDAINKENAIGNKWIMLEFSTLGFIGKLFQAQHLPLIIHFFIMFSYEKPVDWLLDDVFKMKHCYFEKFDCGLKKLFSPSLFQHYGLTSTLVGKEQPLKDEKFTLKKKEEKNSNPPAIYSDKEFGNLYLGNGAFEVDCKFGNESIIISFNNSFKLNSYYIKTGNFDHLQERLKNATVQIQPASTSSSQKEKQLFLTIATIKTILVY